MNVPNWWTLLLLTGAVFRLYRLIAKDTILDIPRSWLVGLTRDWGEGMKVPASYRGYIADFLVCPWCLGFWLTLGWWGAWQLWPHGALVAAAPFAISAGVGLVAKLDSDD